MSASLFGSGAAVNVNVQGSLVPQSFVAAAGQTVFTLTSFTYTPNTNSLLVFINGQRQVVSRDFTETSPGSFTLIEGALLGDFIDVIGFPQVTLTSTIAGSVVIGGSYSVANYVINHGISPKDYPYLAKGDGITDDTAALQAWAAAGGGYLSPGTYNASAPIVGGDGFHITGDGYNSIIRTTSAVLDVIQVTGQGATIENISMTASVTRTAGYFIKFNGAAANSNNYGVVRNCLFTQWFNCVGFINGGATKQHLLDCTLISSINGGIGVTVSSGANSVDVVIRNSFIVGPAGTNLLAGVQVQGVGDLVIDRLSTVKAGIGLNVVPQNGQTVQSLVCSNSYFDSGTGAGVQLNPAVGGSIGAISFTNVWSCTNTHGFLVGTSNTGTITRSEFINCKGGGNAGGFGIYLGGNSVTNTSIIGGSFGQNAHGIYVKANTLNFKISDARIGPVGPFAGNTVNGITIEAGTSDHYTINNNDLRGNTGVALSDGGTGNNKYIQCNDGYNPIANTAIVVGGSPFSYTNNNGGTVTIFVTGGTVSAVTLAGKTVAAATNCCLPVPQGATVITTYSVLPTMSFSGH